MVAAAWRWLPNGGLLDHTTWQRHHRLVVTLIWLHVPALFVFGVTQGRGAVHTACELTLIAATAGAAGGRWAAPRVHATIAAVGLCTCSAMLVHLWGGRAEAHFHFFTVVPLLALYRDWPPFGAALLCVLGHHGLVGTLHPTIVYDHPDAIAHPWVWAFVHGAFIAATSLACIAGWRGNELLLTDPLTGMARRVLLPDRLAQALARTRRNGTLTAVIFLDLDGFKAINDHHGHAVGDRLLSTIGARIMDESRAAETPVRYGGDEFVVICEDLATPEDALHVARRLADGCRRPCRVRDADLHVTCSVGVATTDGSVNGDDLVRAADHAMYVAKRAGRGRLEIRHLGRPGGVEGTPHTPPECLASR